MQTLNGILQGSPQWLAARAEHFCASEAAAMMGASRYITRGDLLQQKAIGVTEEVTPEKQRLFDRGHKAEAMARPIAEKIIGEEVCPVIGVKNVDGLPLLASLDGLTFIGDVIWENKLPNASLVEQVRCNDLEPHYWAQLEHQLLVSGATRVLFTASDGTVENTHHCWYTSQPSRRQALVDGWRQFQADLAAWQPQAVEVKPAGRAPDQLPALHIEVSGKVTASNLAEFKDTALAAIHSVNRNLVTDQDFADAEKAVKWCSDVEDRLAAAKQHALSQTATIDELFRTMDDISAEAKRVRLDLDKLVKARKDAMRLEIVSEHQRALAEHVDGLNKALPRAWVAVPAAAFGDAIKNKRTLTSIREACSVVLAQAKMTANQAAERFKSNRAALHIEGRDWISLFPDFATVGNKAPEDFDAVLQLRIGKHQEAERQAEEARQRAAAQAQAAIQQAATPAVQPPAPAPAVQAVAPAPIAALTVSQMVPVAVPKPAANEAATVKLGEICTTVGSGFSMTALFVETVLGIAPAKVDKAARLYTPTDERRIYAALRDHLNGLLMKQAA